MKNVLTIVNGEISITLVFRDAKDREDHVIAERKFCKKEQAIYSGGLSGTTRLNKKLRNDQRVKFAKQTGFTPSMNDRTRWLRIPVQLKPEPKGVA